MKKIFLVFVISVLFLFNSVHANEKANVAYTIDHNYVIPLLLSVNSLIVSNTSHLDYTFYIVENDLNQKDKEIISKFISDNKQNVEFVHLDTSIIDNGVNFYNFYGINRITRIAMARIILADIVPKTVHKILYLDADTLVNTDLKELFATKMGRYHTAMVLNHTSDNHSEAIHKFKYGYYNSGVILMDLDKWRRNKISQKLLNYLHKNRALFIQEEKEYRGNRFLFTDQDLINVVLERQIKTLPNKWNNQAYTLQGFKGINIYCYRVGIPISKQYSLVSTSKPSIIHYIGNNKPWLFILATNNSQYMYFKYWWNSPFILYKLYYIPTIVYNKYICIKKLKNSRFNYHYYNFVR